MKILLANFFMKSKNYGESLMEFICMKKKKTWRFIIFIKFVWYDWFKFLVWKVKKKTWLISQNFTLLRSAMIVINTSQLSALKTFGEKKWCLSIFYKKWEGKVFFLNPLYSCVNSNVTVPLMAAATSTSERQMKYILFCHFSSSCLQPFVARSDSVDYHLMR